jgi:hypothetical protein
MTDSPAARHAVLRRHRVPQPRCGLAVALDHGRVPAEAHARARGPEGLLVRAGARGAEWQIMNKAKLYYHFNGRSYSLLLLRPCAPVADSASPPVHTLSGTLGNRARVHSTVTATSSMKNTSGSSVSSASVPFTPATTLSSARCQSPPSKASLRGAGKRIAHEPNAQLTAKAKEMTADWPGYSLVVLRGTRHFSIITGTPRMLY